MRISNPFDAQLTRHVTRCDTTCRRRNTRLVLGPPGTGKTTTLLAHLEHEIENIPPDRVAFVTFTRSARKEARDRARHKLRLSDDALHWCRTIHSVAYELLGVNSEQVLDQESWREFAACYGYDLSSLRSFRQDEDMGEAMFSAADDALPSTLSWGRSKMLLPEEAMSQSPFSVGTHDFLKFVERYNGFKRERGKIDFHDMLELAMRSHERPDVDVAIIDEAQDLSPLQVALVEKWFAPCRRVYVGGDDDQAIMAFQGGDPTWLLQLAEECELVTKLEWSFRLPGLIHSCGKKLISRNQDRVDKPYWPRDEAGWIGIDDMTGAISWIRDDEDTFVLARNWYMLKQFADDLAQRGVPFWVEKHANWSPHGKPTVLSAIRAADDLNRGRKAQALDFARLIALFPTRGKTTPGGLPRGVKKAAKENRDSVSADEVRRKWDLPMLIEAIERHGPVLAIPKIDKELGFHLSRMMDRFGTIPKPRVTLTTIHSAKGREADDVVILSDVTRASYLAQTQGSRQDQEGENRVAYVGVTRAKKRLLVVSPQTDKYYPYGSIIAAVQREGVSMREPGDDDPNKIGW